MAQWKETKEPYVQVIESVKRATQNPAAGTNLIIGAVIVSDSGPTTPLLISSRSEFLQNYASESLSSSYMENLDSLWTNDNGDKNNFPSTMFLNGYRLSGSCQMLVCRASSACGVQYMKSLKADSDESKEYVLKDSEVLVRLQTSTISISKASPDGWLISIDGVGTLGNRVTDDGPQYDYYVDSLEALVEKLNESDKFYCPKYTPSEDGTSITLDEVYVSDRILNVSDERTLVESSEVDTEGNKKTTNSGYVNMTLTGFDSIPSTDIDYKAINSTNASSEIKVIIRKYNHEAVEGTDSNGDYIVNNEVVENIDKKLESQDTPKSDKDRILKNDFYEFRITDPSNESEMVYSVGESSGRGDISMSDLQGMMEFIEFDFPNDLSKLGLTYYDKESEDSSNEVNIDLSVPVESGILKIDQSSIFKAWDLIQEDERYIVEGVSDLGCTDTFIQNYISTLAMSTNSFYAVSTANTTNYMLIANHASKINTGSSPMNLYFLAPWDYDDRTVGFRYNCSPAIMYWETVAKNRASNNEFAGVLGQNNGIVSPVNLSKDFTKKERQLLLTKKINTIFNDLSSDITYINDNWTRQEEVDVMQEENNVRLKIRISKGLPLLLKQFIGRQSNVKTWNDAYGVVSYWFNNSIKTMNYSIADVRIICDETNNTEETIRANKLVMRVMVRYYNSTKYIEVYHDAYPKNIWDIME